VKLDRDLREFIELLNSHQVEYLIVGGHAVGFHGHPRFTGDIDFLLAATESNAQRVLATLRAFGFGDLALTPSDFTSEGQVVQLGRPPNRIDLLTSISGVSFEEAWSDRTPSSIDSLPVQFIGLNALLKNKRASGRPKDLADAAKLEAVALRRKK
jgi:hypothetical protein